MGSSRIGGVQEWEPPDKTRRLALSQHKEVQDLPSISDPINARCKTRSDVPETQGMAPGSTNQIPSSNTQDGQGSRQICRQLPEREREARPEVSQGERQPHKDPQGCQDRQVPPHDRPDSHPHRNWWQRLRAESQREIPALKEVQDTPGARSSNSRNHQEKEPADRSRPPSPAQPVVTQETPQVPASHLNTTEARGKASYGGTEGQGAPPRSVHGQDLAGQSAINNTRRQWQRTVDGLNTDAKPENPSESHVHPHCQLRDTQQQDRQEDSAGRSSEGPDPTPNAEQELPGAGALKNKSFQGQEPPVSVRRTPTIQPEDFQETINRRPQTQGKHGQDEEQGDMNDKRITGGDRQKPRDPEDKALRKLFVGNMNAATNCAAMQSYFEKFGEVERCYCTIRKESNKYEDYGFVVFRAAATEDELWRTRPHTIMGRMVKTRRAVPEEWKGNPEAETRSKKICIARVHGP